MNTKALFRWPQKLTAALWLIPICMADAQTGVPLWTNRYDGGYGGNANAIAVDGNGNVIVTGSSPSPGDPLNNDYATIKYSGAGEPLWTNRYNGPANVQDYASAVAVDGSGNVFVTGLSDGGGPRGNYATIKYSGAGEPIWTNRYNGTGGAAAVAVDGSGNVVVTGQSFGTSGSYDYATIKYSGAGEPLWTNRYDGPGSGYDAAVAMAVDGNGNVVVTGISGVSGVYFDYATIKYSSDGVPLWTNRYNGTGESRNEVASAIAVDGNGNVVVTGISDNGFNAYFAYATIKYSGAGAPLWTNRYSGPGNGHDSANALAVDRSGNVFVTGSSISTNGDYDYATIKYSSDGVPLWTNRYDGGYGGNGARTIAVDGNGNVFVTGSSRGRDGYSDYATIKYSGAGVPLWTNRYDGTGNGNDSAIALAVDGSGNVFVTGSSIGTSGDYDYTTIKYSGAGLSPIPLNYQIVGNQLVLSWTNAVFSLQSAPAAEGAYTNISGATSPYTNLFWDAQRYFRLNAN
jgi:uncharacterized membrane-anchored protein